MIHRKSRYIGLKAWVTAVNAQVDDWEKRWRKGVLPFAVLGALKSGPRHGYALAVAVKDVLGGQHSRGHALSAAGRVRAGRADDGRVGHPGVGACEEDVFHYRQGACRAGGRRAPLERVRRQSEGVA